MNTPGYYTYHTRIEPLTDPHGYCFDRSGHWDYLVIVTRNDGEVRRELIAGGQITIDHTIARLRAELEDKP